MKRLAILLASVASILVVIFTLGNSPAKAKLNVSDGLMRQAVTQHWSHPKTRQVIVKPAAQVSSVTYTVRPGDTLSSIAKSQYGNASLWPALWYVNRHKIANPNDIAPPLVLQLSSWHPSASWILTAATNAIPKPVITTVAAVTPSGPQSAPQPTAPTSSGPWPGGAFGNCVVERESGGNPNVWNASGHWGLYQFSASTWAEYGGNPADFGNAGIAEQEQVFMNALAQGGQDNWAPYDGC